MLIRELMSRNVEWTTPDTTLTQAARRMRDRNIGYLPVGDSSNFLGILTEKDFTTRATAEGANPTTEMVGQIITEGAVYCREEDNITDAVQAMQESHLHHLPVLDATNKVVGFVSLSDLALRGP